MKVWDQFLCQLDIQLGQDTVDRWLRPLRIARFDAANLYLEANDSFQVSWFEEHIRPRIQGFKGNNGRPIRIHLSCPTEKKKPPRENSFLFPSVIKPDPLDREMLLEYFVRNRPSNAIAYDIVAEAAKCLFNPVLFYGPPSSGKTHLLMSTAAILQNKGWKVFYVRAETFTEHIVQAIRKGTMQDVRATYRSVDALLVDDIHIFSRKTATQEEFFHTFNELHTRGRPILLSSQVPPLQLTEIEPRLVSRFEWGISVSIEKEDWAPILERKAKLWNLALDPGVIPFLIQKFPSSPLLGLQALVLRAKENTTLLTSSRAANLLKDLIAKTNNVIWTSEQIIKTVAAHYGIRTSDILGRSQSRDIAVPRQIAMHLCREKLHFSFQKIGEIFKRDHSTVMASIKQVQAAISKQNPELCQLLQNMERNQ